MRLPPSGGRALNGPLLDMSDVVTDVDFLDSLTCQRNQQVIDDTGTASLITINVQFRAVVTSARGSDVRRNPDGGIITQTITIVGLFPLITAGTQGGNQFTADIVTWNGQNYTVTHVDNYSHFGRGFTQATAELLPLTN